MEKIGFVSLGCSKNLIDTEVMLGILRDRHMEITEDLSQADIIIVNTCTFIEKAKQESISACFPYQHPNLKMTGLRFPTAIILRKSSLLKTAPDAC